MVRIITTRAAAWPAAEIAFPPVAVDLAQRLHEAIERRIDELGRLPRPDAVCAHCGAPLYFPYPPVLEEEAWPHRVTR